MLVFAIILISITGVLCKATTEECYNKIHEGCDHRLFPDRFPETTEELDSICQNMKTYAKCIMGFFEECGDEKDISFMQNAITFLDERCDPKNPTYKAISSDLTCVMTALGSALYTCTRKISEEQKKIIESHVNSSLEQDDFSEENVICILVSWQAACTSMTVGDKCGEAAKDAILDVYLNMDYHFWSSCRKEFFAEITDLIEALYLAKDEENILENIIRRKK